jgi:Ca2+-binding EF-hand superfamily protein
MECISKYTDPFFLFQDQYEKEFIYRHSASIFRLIDADDSKLINSNEFSQMGVLFNFDYNSILSIFNEFDVSGVRKLEALFKLF